MKKIPCGNPTCNLRREHFTRQDEMRQHKMVEVPDDYEGKSFCSITCACIAGYFDVQLPSGWIKDPAKD